MTRIPASVLIALSALMTTPLAEAHPVVKDSDPRDGAVVERAPSEIRITFSEVLIPKFSGLEVKDKDGHVMASGRASNDDDKTLVAPLSAPLKPGTYQVIWHAVSADTHRVKGQYAFTVKG